MSSTPPPPSYGLSVFLLRPLAEALGRLGESPQEFLAKLGVDATTTPDAYVDCERVDQALDEIAAARGDECLGLTLASAAVVGQFGFFGHLVWLSSTLREALSRAITFYSLMTQRIWLEVSVRGGRAILSQRLMPNAPRGTVLIVFAFAMLVLYGRRVGGHCLRLRAVHLKHTSPEAARYEAFFGVPVHLGASNDELHLDAEHLDEPLGSADPITAELLAREAERIKSTSRTTEPFLHRARKAIATGLCGSDQGLPRLAHDLGLSPRTVQRRLSEHGTSHRELLDEVRREVATRLLSDSERTAGDIARELGLSGSQALTRAFHRWTGMTPSEFRTLARKTARVA